MRQFAVLSLLIASPVFAGEGKNCAQPSCVTGYVEETIVVKRPVTIKRTPIIETREKQVTVKEDVVVGYKEEVVPATPKKRLLGNLFRKRGCACGSCE